MTQPTKSQAIKMFLTNKTHADLAENYNIEMECQVNVARDGGEKIDGEFRGRSWHGYSDGINQWKPFRIPHNAATNPEYTDTIMQYDLAEHAEGIGMTGWNWQRKESIYVGFDFDAIAGHSESHKGKLTDNELAIVQTKACEIPWVTVRKSTSGSGLHLYVYVDAVPTENHNEHAALARSILGMMSAKIGFDFHNKVDVSGGNLWVWHRKMVGTDGLSLIKKGIVLDNIPHNWRDHVPVIKGLKAKTLPKFIESSDVPEIDKIFDDLTGQRSNVQLDEIHRKLIDWLAANNCIAHWDQDRWMLVTHTADLKRAHTELDFRGIFETTTRQSSDLNCFAFPHRKGSWVVRRFSPGVQEHACWTQDGAGWTTCYYNRLPDLATACKAKDGQEHKSGGFVFQHASDAIEAAALVGVNFDVPPHAAARQTKLKENRDGKLLVEIKQDHSDISGGGGLPGWILESKTWSKVFTANLRQPTEIESSNNDDTVRHLTNESLEDCGWTISSSGQWIVEPLAHIKIALQGALGLTPKEVTSVVGASILKHWKLVNKPFQPEYPGDRQWNRKAAQFVYNQTENRDSLYYPTWNRVLRHCGSGLDDAIKANGWCQVNGVLNGGDYLKIWIASLFQKPMERLPYLFFYSQEQNTGKSIFHEALSELVTSGVERADVALTNQQGFNGEIANAVLCVVEELDLSKSKVAYNRIKDWVTGRTFQAHFKGGTPFSIPNTTHWVQTANSHTYCPIGLGDTRITMTYVKPIPVHDLIPKEKLIEMLRKEAPDFMAEIMNLEIPVSNDRLNVPIILTGESLAVQKSSMTRLEAFLAECTHHVLGKMIKLSDLHERFQEWLDPADRYEWTKTFMGRNMPPQHPKGRSAKDGGHFYFGNISWQARQPNEPLLPKLVLSGEMLIPIEEHHAN